MNFLSRLLGVPEPVEMRIKREVRRLEGAIARFGVRFPASRAVLAGHIQGYPLVNLRALQFVLRDGTVFAQKGAELEVRRSTMDRSIDSIARQAAREEAKTILDRLTALSDNPDSIVEHLGIVTSLFSLAYSAHYSVSELESEMVFVEYTKQVRFIFPQSDSISKDLLGRIKETIERHSTWHLTSPGRYDIGREIIGSLRFGVGGSWDRVCVQGPRELSAESKTFDVSPCVKGEIDDTA